MQHLQKRTIMTTETKTDDGGDAHNDKCNK